jgi:hypothetical protein
MRVAILGLVLVGAAGVARADDPSPAGPPQRGEPKLVAPVKPAKPDDTLGFSHKGQFELSVRFAIGLRAIATYDKTDYCGQTDATADTGLARVCTGRAPLSLDFELGYGVARKIDLFAEIRFSLEQDFGASPTATDGARLFHLSPGARFFFSESGKTKLFTTGQVVFDLSGYKNVAGASLGTDFGLRNMSGLWFDLDKAYGFYVFIGETATFARWLRFELEGGVGIQGRYR